LLNLHAKLEVSSFNRSGDMGESQNSKSGSRDPFTTSFELILHFFFRAPRAHYACQNLKFLALPFQRYGGGPRIPKVGRGTASGPL